MAYEVLYLQTGETPARLDRWWIDRVFAEGVNDVQAGDFAVSERAGAANLSVDVAPGAAIVDGDDTTDQGAYLVRLTAGVNLPLAAPPAADSRIDLVVLRVNDSTATGVGDGTTDGAVVEVVQGAPAAAPVAPALPATAIPLAEVTIAAGDTAITNNEIADRRAQLNAETLDVGTQSIPLTTAEREAMNDPQPGTLVFDTDLGSLMIHTGTVWAGVHEVTQTFTASGTWTKPAGAKRVKVTAVGGGGGGGASRSATYNFAGSGGGGGACIEAMLDADDLPATVSVTVGAGGTGGTANQDNATAGGTSSFGSYASAYGGGQGRYSLGSDSNDYASGGGGGGQLTAGGGGDDASSGSTPQNGGQPRHTTGGQYPNGTYAALGGGAGSPSTGYASVWGGGGGGGNGGAGGASIHGGGGGGSGTTAGGAAGGVSTYAGNGGQGGGDGASGQPGVAPGGGGGGAGKYASAYGSGGNGARGEVRVTVYYY